MDKFIPHTGRPKFDFRTTNTENFRQLKKDYPEFRKLKVSAWRGLILAYTEKYKEHLLETGDMLDIQGECGNLAIKKKKRRKLILNPHTGKTHINLPVDWKKTNALGKKVYIMNYHTDGYHFGWIWFKQVKKTGIKFPNIWKFQAMKKAKNLLFTYLMKDQKYQHIYREWSDNTK